MSRPHRTVASIHHAPGAPPRLVGWPRRDCPVVPASTPGALRPPGRSRGQRRSPKTPKEGAPRTAPCTSLSHPGSGKAGHPPTQLSMCEKGLVHHRGPLRPFFSAPLTGVRTRGQGKASGQQGRVRTGVADRGFWEGEGTAEAHAPSFPAPRAEASGHRPQARLRGSSAQHLPDACTRPSANPKAPSCLRALHICWWHLFLSTWHSGGPACLSLSLTLVPQPIPPDNARTASFCTSC